MRRNAFNVDCLALQFKSVNVTSSCPGEDNNTELHIEQPVPIPTARSSSKFPYFFSNSISSSSEQDWIFLGSVDTAMNRDILLQQKITHIMIVARELYPFYPGDFKYKKIPIDDDEEEPLIAYSEECFNFIDSVHQEGGRVLIHCRGGVSRSATVIIAYLMKTNSWGYKQAENHLRLIHHSICPNDGFVTQLVLFEKMHWSIRGNSGHHQKYREVHLTKAKALNHKRKLEEERKEREEENKSRKLEIGSAKEEYGYYLRAIETQFELPLNRELVET